MSLVAWSDLTEAIADWMVYKADSQLTTDLYNAAGFTIYQTMCRRSVDVPPNYSVLAPIIITMPEPLRAGGERTICDPYIARYAIVVVYTPARIGGGDPITPEEALLGAQKCCEALRESIGRLPSYGQQCAITQMTTQTIRAPAPMMSAAIMVEARVRYEA